MLDMNDREVLEKFDEFVRDAKESLANFDDRETLESHLHNFFSFSDFVRETLEVEARFEQLREDARGNVPDPGTRW